MLILILILIFIQVWDVISGALLGNMEPAGEADGDEVYVLVETGGFLYSGGGPMHDMYDM